jgi:hypothetical protein
MQYGYFDDKAKEYPITNQSDRPREYSVFSFCEFTNLWDTYQDQVNLQYSLFIVQGNLTDDGLLRITIQDNLTPETDGFFIHDITLQFQGVHSSGF